MPDGPFWLIYDNFFIQIYFKNGEIIKEDVLLINIQKKQVFVGNLKNNTYILETQSPDINDIRFKQYECMKILKIPEKPNPIIPKYKNDTKIRLPLKIFALPQEHRIMVRPSKILNYNRIAKTGSVGIMHLLGNLRNF